MDSVMDVIKNSEEPEWLEKQVIGGLRLWQLVFLCLAAAATLIVMVCCCFRFRIPRTKQQIEADYKRRQIASKFRQQLETIQDTKMDAMSLKDALDLLHEKTKAEMDAEKQGSQPSSITSPQQSSFDASFQPEGGQKPEPQVSRQFARFAGRVATITKLGQPKTPTSPNPSNKEF
ncbi:transmembrane inner ear expressed protein [Plodia interpunctella]|uniref:transmembrane inner ear expressed protein n=1 Tax=Plodia interpunctella TaxID=58824 RepID=UPI002367A2D7|nr:transmembrane inner ear expressed protein [Plodia interpunctella]